MSRMSNYVVVVVIIIDVLTFLQVTWSISKSESEEPFLWVHNQPKHIDIHVDHQRHPIDKECNITFLWCTCSLVGDENRRFLIWMANTNPNPLEKTALCRGSSEEEEASRRPELAWVLTLPIGHHCYRPDGVISFGILQAALTLELPDEQQSRQ